MYNLTQEFKRLSCHTCTALRAYGYNDKGGEKSTDAEAVHGSAQAKSSTWCRFD